MAKSIFMPLSSLQDLGFIIKPHKDNVYNDIHKRMVSTYDAVCYTFNVETLKNLISPKKLSSKT